MHRYSKEQSLQKKMQNQYLNKFFATEKIITVINLSNPMIKNPGIAFLVAARVFNLNYLFLILLNMHKFQAYYSGVSKISEVQFHLFTEIAESNFSIVQFV